ncbi:hypothetical protein, partial [Aquicoccus sp.]|uniref:hypothetical protein n=1 Tax=Aquicoccus sp. TaxID=2055851 RepID=UPI003569D7BA
LAPVAVNYGPFRQMLTPDCSLMVTLGDRAAHVEGYRQAMERLATDPARCRRLGQTHINARSICSPGPPGRARSSRQILDKPIKPMSLDLAA